MRFREFSATKRDPHLLRSLPILLILARPRAAQPLLFMIVDSVSRSGCETCVERGRLYTHRSLAASILAESRFICNNKKKKRKPLSIFSPSSLAATSSRANYVFMHSGVRKYYVSFCMTFAYLDTLRAARTRLCLLKLELRYRRIDFDAFCSGGRANDKSIRSSAFSSSYDYFFFIFNREESS